jgi:hypothetical protein
MASLSTSLSLLKQQFIEELELLLSSCTYDEQVAVFMRQLHSDLRALISHTDEKRSLEVPLTGLDDEFRTLALPQTQFCRSRKTDSIEDHIMIVNQQFADSTSAILDRVAKAHTEVRRMKTPPIETSTLAQKRLARVEFDIEAAEIECRIMKEHLDSRFQRLNAERTAFHDQQTEQCLISETDNCFPRSMFRDLDCLNPRKRIQTVARKAGALSLVVQDVGLAIQILSSHIQMSAEAILLVRERLSSNTPIAHSSHQRNLITAVNTKLQVLEHRRREITYSHPFLKSV